MRAWYFDRSMPGFVVQSAHTYQALRSARPAHPVTQEALAERLDVTVRSLQRFLKRHDMGWPLA